MIINCSETDILKLCRSHFFNNCMRRHSCFNPPSIEVMASDRELYVLFPDYPKELARVGVCRRTLWTEYSLKHPAGLGDRQFCYRFGLWQASQKVTMHLEHKTGDKLFVDFASDKLYMTDIETGQLIPVEFFVAILPCSQLNYA